MDLYSRICTNVKFPDLIMCYNYVVWGNWGKSSMDLFGLFLVTSCESTFLLKYIFWNPTSISGRQMRQMLWILWFGFPNTHSPMVSCSLCPHFPFGHSQPRKFPWKHVTWACMLPWARPIWTYLGAGVEMVALCTGLRSGRLEVWKPHKGAVNGTAAWKAWVRNGERNPFLRKLFDTHIQSCLWVSFGQFHFWANTSHKFESRQLFVAYPITWIVHS